MIFFALLAMCLLTGCAKTGEPQPPAVLIPKAAKDLSARQRADMIILTLTRPTENTDGSAVSDLGEIEVLRMPVVVDPGSAPQPEADFLSRAQRVILVPAGQWKTYLTDGMIAFSDPLVPADLKALSGAEYLYAVRIFNRKHQTAGLSNQFRIRPVALPGPPAGLASVITQDFIRLTWVSPDQNSDGSKPANILGYKIYRSSNPQAFPAASINQDLLHSPEFEDHNFEFDVTYYYRVVIVGRLESPSAETLPSATLTVIARDLFPPVQPRNLNLVVEDGTVVLLWAASANTDVSGYRIYRQEEGKTERVSLQSELITSLIFRDAKVPSGKTYIYSVTAVDTHGNEGAPAQSTVEVR